MDSDSLYSPTLTKDEPPSRLSTAPNLVVENSALKNRTQMVDAVEEEGVVVTTEIAAEETGGDATKQAMDERP